MNPRKIRTPLIVVAIILSTFVLLHSRLQRIEESPPIADTPWALAVATARKGRVTDGFPALARVESANDVRLSAQIGGTVEQVGPRAGAMVATGDLLVRLDTRDLEAQAASVAAKIRQVQAAVGHDHNELDRERKLLQEGGSSESAVEQWETRFLADQASERSLELQRRSLLVKISYGRILAPTGAGVAAREVDTGDTVKPGQLLYQLTSEQGGRVVVPVPQNTATSARPGTPVELRSAEGTLLTKVTRVRPALDALSMGRLEIDLPERPFGLPEGAHVAARVITRQSETAVVVPRSALVPASRIGERTVFKVVAGQPERLQRTPVAVVLCGGEGCAISRGLEPGDRVVTASGNTLLLLHDGDAVLTERTSP